MRFGMWEIALIALIIFLIFGGIAKLPAMAKNLAKGIKTFKEEVKDEPVKKKKPAKKK